MDFRLNNQDIENDPEYLIAAFPTGQANDWYPDEETELSYYFSEQLAYRLIRVAEAYQLHFPNQLAQNRTDRAVLRSNQVESLVDQLEFLRDLLNDELLEDVIRKILLLARNVSHSNGSLELVFEGP